MWKLCKSLTVLLNHWFVFMCLFKAKTFVLWKSLSKRIKIERILLKKNLYTIKGQEEMQKNCQWPFPHSCMIMD